MATLKHQLQAILGPMKTLFSTSMTPLLRGVLLASIAPVPYSEYILAPESRTVHPVGVHQIVGAVNSAASLLWGPNGSAVFNGPSAVTFDYGKNIAGVVSVEVGFSSSKNASIGLTYTESSLWINTEACDATGGPQLDEILWLPVGNGPGTYTVERYHERGAFRYLSLVTNFNASIEVKSVSTQFTAAPVQDLRGYKGYFHCNDEQLNRIWYAGAYTNQLCTIDPVYGDASLHVDSSNSKRYNVATIPWYNNVTIANGSSVVVDGAKRDREIWPGDMVVAMPSVFVSTNDLMSFQNSLNALLMLQDSSGLLPYAGYPFNTLGVVSFTYHLHSLIGIAYYYHFSGDLDYLRNVWDHFTRGLAWSLGHVDSSGLMDVTSDADWLRGGMGGHNIEANAILYYTVNQGLHLASTLNDSASISAWAPIAPKIKEAANNLLWDKSANLYKDNENSNVYPQDGNTWAIKANLTISSSQNFAISSALKARWGHYGAPAPETGSPATVSPFIGSLELEAHFLSGNPQNAIDLMRLQWGDFMLDDPRMTNSTFIEGYSSTGSLHYPLYASDAIISHAHGWSTGPTSSLSFYVAGIRLLTASGQTWRIEPMVGDLTEVEAGFVTKLGAFENFIKTAGGNGGITSMRFVTPEGTSGSVSLPGIEGKFVNSLGKSVALVDGEANGLDGGDWTLVMNSRKIFFPT